MTTPWLREGNTLYELTTQMRQGKECSVNKWHAWFDHVCNCTPEELEAVICLAQAAPQLLAALKRTLSYLTSYRGGGTDAVYEQARAAIALAEKGKQS